MNDLQYFWNNGFEQQMDIFEGVSCDVDINKVKSIFPDELQNAIVHDIALQPVGYSYCNVFCASKIEIKRVEAGVQITAPAEMNKFGEKAVIIKDVEKFLTRVRHSACSHGFDFVCGDINYCSPTTGGHADSNKSKLTWKSMQPVGLDVFGNDSVISIKDAFDKHIKYEGQMEWRIVLYRGVKESKAYDLDIGCLEDIVEVVDATKMKDKCFIEELCRKYDHDSIGYQGTTSRDDLRKKFIELGDNKYWFFMST